MCGIMYFEMKKIFSIFVFIIGFLSFGDAKGESCVSQPKKALSVHHPLGDFCIMRQELQLDGEIWKDIPGYEVMYQVSSIGRVKSLDRIILHKDGKITTIKNRILLSNLNKI
jgi:hypothetical protein